MARIALIHALTHSMGPINRAFELHWPQAAVMNLLDDSLSSDLAKGSLDARMYERFETLATYAVGCGADAILFTCSAFGPCIDAVARKYASIPVLRPNEAMIAAAVAQGNRIGLVASFAPTLRSMPAEFPSSVNVDVEWAEGALEALERGDLAQHDMLAACAAQRLSHRGCDVIALAQFSLARAADTVQSTIDVPVLTTVDSAVEMLMRRIKLHESTRAAGSVE